MTTCADIAVTVVAHPDHGDEGAVPISHGAERFHRIALGERGVDGKRLVVSDRNGDGAVTHFAAATSMPGAAKPRLARSRQVR